MKIGSSRLVDRGGGRTEPGDMTVLTTAEAGGGSDSGGGGGRGKGGGHRMGSFVVHDECNHRAGGLLLMELLLSIDKRGGDTGNSELHSVTVHECGGDRQILGGKHKNQNIGDILITEGHTNALQFGHNGCDAGDVLANGAGSVVDIHVELTLQHDACCTTRALIDSLERSTGIRASGAVTDILSLANLNGKPNGSQPLLRQLLPLLSLLWISGLLGGTIDNGPATGMMEYHLHRGVLSVVVIVTGELCASGSGEMQSNTCNNMTTSASRALPHSYLFSSAEGQSLCHKILSSCLPYDPHDYQLDGVCKALDGVDVLAVTPTGSGKTGFLTMYLLVVCAILREPALCPTVKFKHDPAMLIVCPTKSLEFDMQEPKFKAVGLSSVVINPDTVEAARHQGRDLWKLACEGVAVILLALEQLRTQGFKGLIRDKYFESRIMAFCVDEAHLIFLEMHVGGYHLIRRSNARYDIQLVFHDMESSPKGWQFPELDWVLEQGRCVIVFCMTISQGFRVVLYLWQKAQNLSEQDKHVHSRARVTIATDTLALGIDIAHTDDVVLYGNILRDSDLVVQKAGRIHDGRGKNTRVVIYLPRNATELAKRVLALKASDTSPAELDLPAGLWGTSTMDLSMTRLIMAPCKVDAINQFYGNDTTARCYDSSGVLPAIIVAAEGSTLVVSTVVSAVNPTTTVLSIPTVPGVDASCDTDPRPTEKTPVPMAKRITQDMCKVGATRFKQLRLELWKGADQIQYAGLPSEEFIPDFIVDNILDNFCSLRDRASVAALVLTYEILANHHGRLLDIIEELRVKFGRMYVAKKDAANAKRRETVARRREAKHTAAEGAIQTRTPGDDDESEKSTEE
ncbi:P-loop containing nucleoside triphosphate hydrolase protein [Amylocystis lapponica]|nr:P-loop containing nucleoside triphosphate hydrolase protein [Amylocystis lapponica]